MPMYYFNLKGNGQHRPAEAPIDFVNLDVAKAEVLQSIRVAFDADAGGISGQQPCASSTRSVTRTVKFSMS